MKPAPPSTPDALAARRAELIERPGLRGRALSRALSDLVDGWLAEVFAVATAGRSGLALVAVGGHGRRELCPGSDLDLLLLHDGGGDLGAVADALWYPVWDAGTRLGHAVRTTKESLRLAADDLETATALLDARHLAGDPRLTAGLAAAAVDQWARRSRRWLARLDEALTERHARAGEVAFLLEPDLKDGRGGLRDVHALGWAQAAGAVPLPDDPASLADEHDVLLAARVELHRVTGRSGDRLLLQEQDAVAERLGTPDADALMHGVASAARRIAWASDDTWECIRRALDGRPARGARRRRELAPGVVCRDGRVGLGSDAAPGDDPGLVLRVAAAAALEGLSVERAALDHLAVSAPVLDGPWPPGARRDLVRLLGAGPAAVEVWEALDRHDLITRVLPEWAPVRSRPQRNPYHRFTVDRHLCEAAAQAASLATDVGRPDLLLVGTWLHDLGKGQAGDHTVAGMELMGAIAPRMGFDDHDTATLVGMVEHHLLLPDVATRRDLDDDGTIASVAERVGSVELLELLAAQTEADSLATGPAAWSRWKATLVHRLVERLRHVLGGGHAAEVTADGAAFDEEAAAAADRGAQLVTGAGDRLTVVTVDRPGVLASVAGAVALCGLTVLSADAGSRSGSAITVLTVERDRGEPPDWDRVVVEVERALAGRLSIEARLVQRARTYRSRTPAPDVGPVRVILDNDSTDAATVVEVRAPDSAGLLYRVARALADLQLDIRSARVQTLGPAVVDSFYVTDAEGKQLTDAQLVDELTLALEHAAEDRT